MMKHDAAKNVKGLGSSTKDRHFSETNGSSEGLLQPGVVA